MPEPSERLPYAFPGCGHDQYGWTVLSSSYPNCDKCGQFFCPVCRDSGCHSCPNCFNVIQHGDPEGHRCPATDADSVDHVEHYWRELRQSQHRYEQAQVRAEQRARGIADQLRTANTRLRQATGGIADLTEAATRAADSIRGIPLTAVSVDEATQISWHNLASASNRTPEPGLVRWASLVHESQTWRTN